MTCRDSLDLVDVAVVGAGPAGLSAALYAARAGLTTGVFGDPYEGQLARAGTVENFPTYKQPVEGLQLVESMVDQAGHWGATIRDQEIRQIVRHDDRFQLLNQEADAFVRMLSSWRWGRSSRSWESLARISITGTASATAPSATAPCTEASRWRCSGSGPRRPPPHFG